jgi:hypothetical protein
MKKIMFLLIFFPAILSNGCKKEDITDTIDITQFSWKLKKISVDGNKIKVKEDDYFNNEAYILVFENDSIFRLNSSVNLAKGSYQITTKGYINVLNYQEITKVGGQNEIDDKLLQVTSKITSYKVLENILLLKGDNCEIELKKE